MGVQQIKFDIQKEEFYIENVEDILHKEIKTKLPLSAWGLTKEVEASAIVVQERQNDSLEEPSKFTYWKIPLKFAVKPDYKDYYLTTAIQGGFDDENWKKTTRVFMRNLANNTTVLADIPQTPEVALAMPYTVKKLKSTKIAKAELKKILLEGSSIGIFRSLDLLERIVT